MRWSQSIAWTLPAGGRSSTRLWPESRAGSSELGPEPRPVPTCSAAVERRTSNVAGRTGGPHPARADAAFAAPRPLGRRCGPRRGTRLDRSINGTGVLGRETWILVRRTPHAAGPTYTRVVDEAEASGQMRGDEVRMRPTAEQDRDALARLVSRTGIPSKSNSTSKRRIPKCFRSIELRGRTPGSTPGMCGGFKRGSSTRTVDL